MSVMPRRRCLAEQAQRDIELRMVFVAGPRQVGKTTFARSLPGARAGYLNWNVATDRERILTRRLPPGPFWVFDAHSTHRDHLVHAIVITRSTAS
jgi:hypothetical protein